MKDDYLHSFFQLLNLNFDEQDYIRDMALKHGGVNWKDALGNSQTLSKIRLVDTLSNYLQPNHTVVLIGGWIGLIPFIMNSKSLKCKEVINIEIDQVALEASDYLNANATSFLFSRLFEDALEVDYSQWKDLVVINTSCEHLIRYHDWMSLIPEGTFCILQSNNMFGHPEHVNCHKDIKEFEKKSGLSSVSLKEEIGIGDEWLRFMLAGTK